MGIDIHCLNFIRYASKKQSLGKVATIGRQVLEIPGWLAARGAFCEEFLAKHFGATLVDSYDFSDYEGATCVVDMNKPLVPEKQYDTVIDFGCIEHIYNAPQALTNVSLLCASAGQIMHVLPANNFCGHGFWQFSPELFFSLYSGANGYSQTEVFLADLGNHTTWFEVKQPKNGARAIVNSKSPLYVLCRTVRASKFSHDNVQQSDYVHSWGLDRQVEPGSNGIRAAAKGIIKRNAFLYRLAQSVYGKLNSMRSPSTLSGRNPHLLKRRVSVLVDG